MPIQDSASNDLLIGSGDTGEMLGYVEPDLVDDVLNLDMYNFLIHPIRRADLVQGNLFAKRFLEGPQAIWRSTQANIFRLLQLWDVVNCPDEYLTYLKNIVGWTTDLERPITDRVDSQTLRRLISLSVPLWKIKGTESGYLNSLLTLVTTRPNINNWFDLRWILDETQMGEDHQGRDPWLIPSAGEYQSDIRIMDGYLRLDRILLINMIKLFRPSGERVTVYWVDFIDQFLVDGLVDQWDSTNVDPINIVDGTLNLDDDSVEEQVNVSVDGVFDWSSYVSYFRIKGTGASAGQVWGAMVYWQDDDNFYKISFELSSNTLELIRRYGGAETVLETYDFVDDSEIVVGDVYYGLRVHVEAITNGTRLRVYVSNLERIDHSDTTSPLLRGSIGVHHAVGATCLLSETEVYQLPLESDFININEGML